MRRVSSESKICLLLVCIMASLILYKLLRVSKEHYNTPQNKGRLFFGNIVPIKKRFKLAKTITTSPQIIVKAAKKEKRDALDAKTNKIRNNTKLRNSSEVFVTENSKINSAKQTLELWNELEPIEAHTFDYTLAMALVKYFKSVNASSILEFAAGSSGRYSKILMKHGFYVSCYDANSETQTLSEGRCGVVDLTKKISFAPAEWLLSLEIGESISEESENVFIDNLYHASSKGLIFSWAIKEDVEDTTPHITNLDNEYLRGVFHNLGYISDKVTEKMLRNSATGEWFKNTIMVFRKHWLMR